MPTTWVRQTATIVLFVIILGLAGIAALLSYFLYTCSRSKTMGGSGSGSGSTPPGGAGKSSVPAGGAGGAGGAGSAGGSGSAGSGS